MILIGIVGNIGVGKSTAKKYLSSLGFESYAFAQPIKEIARIFGFKECEINGTQKEKMQKNEYWGISGRGFMQKFGTDIGRDILPSKIPNMDKIWIQLFNIHISEIKKKESYLN